MAGTGTRSHGWAGGTRAAVPIVLGYLPAAVAFGVAARQAGLSVAEAVLMSVVVYAGASQFALAGMIGSGTPLVAAAATALALNVRHVLYGPALSPLLPRLSRAAAAAGAFGLTDEVFAVASATLPGRPVTGAWLAGLEAASYASWVGGTWLGAAGGQALAARLPGVAGALGFALPALFAALLLPMLLPDPAASHRQARPEPQPEGARAGTAGGRPAVAAAAASAVAGGVVAAAMGLAGWGRWSVAAAGILGPAAGLAVAHLTRNRCAGRAGRERARRPEADPGRA